MLSSASLFRILISFQSAEFPTIRPFEPSTYLVTPLFRSCELPVVMKMESDDWTSYRQDAAVLRLQEATGLGGGVRGLTWQVLSFSSSSKCTGKRKMQALERRRNAGPTVCVHPVAAQMTDRSCCDQNMEHSQRAKYTSWPVSGAACLSGSLPGRSLEDIRAVFDEIDKNQDGKLTEPELVAFAAERGLPTTYVKEFLEAAGVSHAVTLQQALAGLGQNLRQPLRWLGVRRKNDGKGEASSKTVS